MTKQTQRRLPNGWVEYTVDGTRCAIHPDIHVGLCEEHGDEAGCGHIHCARLHLWNLRQAWQRSRSRRGSVEHLPAPR